MEWNCKPHAKRSWALFNHYSARNKLYDIKNKQTKTRQSGTSLSCIYIWCLCTTMTSEKSSVQFSSVQSLSCVQVFATPWTAAHEASVSITKSRSSLRLTSIESGMPSSHLILCRPLLLPSPIPPSIRVFSNESTLRIRWPKYWSFSFSIIPSKEIPGLIFRMDWLDLLAVQGTLKNLLQPHSSKASILQRSAFFTVQLSHPYMTIGKKRQNDLCLSPRHTIQYHGNPSLCPNQ